jgi:Mn2+/Fe2+ NRAMP family transporter
MNEIFLFIHLVTLVVLTIYVIANKLENKVYFLGIVFIGLIGILFFVSNPGLANRFQNQISSYESFSLGNTLLKSIKDFKDASKGEGNNSEIEKK